MRVPYRVKMLWARLWMKLAGRSLPGRLCAGLASLSFPPYHGRYPLRYMNSKGYIAPSARIHHGTFSAGPDLFIGERVTVFQNIDGGPVSLGAHVGLYDGVVVETGQGASIEIGDKSRCQLGCHLAAYKADIRIGKDVGIAPGCRFNSSNHGKSQDGHSELLTKGPIIVEDGAWLGADVKVLSGVTIGKGAVIATGSVVTSDIPPGMVAAGVPAKVVKSRSDLSGHS